MKRVNIEQLTGALNKFRMENLTRSFTTSELYEIFAKLGFNKSIAKSLTRFMEFEKLGTSKLFTFPSTPIHKSQIENLYRSANKARVKQKEEISEDAALALLANKGYQIRKCVGFDLERFAKENPALYKKYLIYETV